MAKKFSVTFEFPTKEARAVFLMWMCDCGGEQEFYDCCDVRGDPQITFDYHKGTLKGKNYVGNSDEENVTVGCETIVR